MDTVQTTVISQERNVIHAAVRKRGLRGRNGGRMLISMLKILADYFGVTIEYFLE